LRRNDASPRALKAFRAAPITHLRARAVRGGGRFRAQEQSRRRPRGAGPQGPWGQSSGPSPPDLEKILRRSQDKLRSAIPGGNLRGKALSSSPSWPSRYGAFRESIKLRPTNSGLCCGSGATYATRNPV
jgi:hypothetical protein